VSTPAVGPTQPPVQWVPGGPFSGGKPRPGRHADNLPSSSAEIKKEQGLYVLSPKHRHGYWRESFFFVGFDVHLLDIICCCKLLSN
jgi:hypothetical protein